MKIPLTHRIIIARFDIIIPKIITSTNLVEPKITPVGHSFPNKPSKINIPHTPTDPSDTPFPGPKNKPPV